jgi:hypothetical protein
MSESLAAVVCRFLTHRRALGRKYHSEERVGSVGSTSSPLHS